MTDRLTTGIEFLDRPLNGGIPPGTLLAIVAPPATQVELLVERLLRPHPSLYVSTLRQASEVEQSFVERGIEGVVIRRTTPSALVDDPDEVLEGVPAGGVVAFDSTTLLDDVSAETYVALLDRVKSRLEESGSVGVLYASDEGASRTRELTLSRADMVWELHRLFNKRTVELFLTISKFRGGPARPEPIRIRLTDEVKIDTSQNIS
ncbi:MAG: hypothetical protein V5A23_01960 [Halobacteriales archaeon]